MSADVPEKRETLWRLAASPTLWAAHFLLCYVVAAVWCAKYAASPDAPLTPVRIAIAVFTGVALLGVTGIGWDGYRRHRLPGGAGDGGHHAADTPEDRHRFMGFATVLLSGLSAIAIVYQALAAVFIGSCR